MRGILARQVVEKVRSEEMEFLGMIRRKPVLQNNWTDPIDNQEETRKKRKMVQEANMKNLGYGEIVLDERWRLLASFEAANGIIMFGWTTAVVVAVVHRVYFVDKGKSHSSS